MSNRLRRAAAPLVLVAWFGGLVLPIFGAGHARYDDPACERPLWAKGHPGTAVENDTQNVGDGHCGICHLQRAVRGALHSVTRTVQYARAITVEKAGCQCDVRAAARDVRSSRAPPSFLFSEAA
ncbi:MAG TPA: hypothetical protein VES67_13215 [Vicinamibacterales bacterium]|nr:hypothetical protein [Vicinamibacterales bacterium]